MPEKLKIPKHVAFIMDGNGRWAKTKGWPRVKGHQEGVKRVKEIINAAPALGIECLTFFAFSTENWSRPQAEISVLMRYLDNFLRTEIQVLHKKNIRFMVIGRDDPLPKYLQKKIKAAEEKTKMNTGLKVVLALNYGGREEIMDAAKKFAHDVLSGKMAPERLEAQEFSAYLYAPELPDPDLLIRTSSEMRLSNFMLWQLTYAEIYFSSCYWPDFGTSQLREAIKEYQKRERRFGGLDAQ